MTVQKISSNKIKVIRNFRDLEVWQESFQLQLEIEELLKSYPPDEKYLLVDQMKRNCRAVPALIVEGWARRESVKELRNYFKNAYGECCETVNHLLLSKYKGYVKKEGYADELIERYEIVGMKLTKLRNNWRKFK
ncbi:hypothetical protein A2865_02200 [Candidatus Woesebacteria bacterium RIFCSPHIGHO2_01_FULL_39_17]|uniref:S23 ribosomal protein n=3 Tax=Candidatus Woeseibacteriota TaxID=1752722 RepID=A0A0G0RJZ5_9BACT|nr:MAG: hypothetical protein US72_C0009G0005 [Microgenomates group bacterium GW2011_GWC1_38_12]KKQ93893.1 MAG: S23 ribosomal protein [Candidatus Woesebacteria bacterium GW2011_GWB1_39_10b]KKR13962.1 MAG: S23 ribosomal protein [Candidatus Woesebacteria bacterium GW2011_GWA1_39_21b]OGM23455.1 MAG: hypothetical protein A2865_02200 [Candidatus Woesebacteria bacterium RIFCSPHIGHO2_01_FULL_39_17]OGM64244.1 MAG: hypothetical protein A3A52_03025 [Candidatus Woesebacteria bacterium RIFCSPLOWO2_01_FULL_3